MSERVALITGGARGIGRAIERGFEIRVLVGRIHRDLARHIIGLFADSESQNPVDRNRAAVRDSRHLHDHAIVVDRQERHGIRGLLRFGNRGAGARRPTTRKINSI